MTISGMDDSRAQAEELEQDATRYPDERGEILLEAADLWQRAGERERAVALLHEVLALGGEESGYARFRLADVCFDQDAEDDAWAHLEALEQAEPSGSGPAELVAELLEERGAHEAALRWFDRAIDRDAVARLLADGNSGDLATALSLFGRQRCRGQLGLPPDELDRAANVAEQRRREWAERLEQLGADGGTRGGSPRPAQPEMLVWPRDELAQAAERWPEVFAADDTAHCADVERRLRQLADERHAKTVTLITGSADEFEQYLHDTDGDPADEAVRTEYAAHVRALGRTTSWPPGRNQPCWCGSARKYKKCCGAPGIT